MILRYVLLLIEALNIALNEIANEPAWEIRQIDSEANERDHYTK